MKTNKTTLYIIQHTCMYLGIALTISVLWQEYEKLTTGKVTEKMSDTIITIIVSAILTYLIRIRK